jgi:hypothetical protein
MKAHAGSEGINPLILPRHSIEVKVSFMANLLYPRFSRLEAWESNTHVRAGN